MIVTNMEICSLPEEYSTIQIKGTAEEIVKLSTNIQYGVLGRSSELKSPKMMKIIFSGPCTILYDCFGKRTIVRCSEEKFDWEKGALMVWLKAFLEPRGWKNLVTAYHDHPKKEKDAAKAIFIYNHGEEILNWYMRHAEEAWKFYKNSQK